MIYYDFRRGLIPKQFIDRLTSTFGDEALSKPLYITVLVSLIVAGLFTDEFKEGRPKSVGVPQHIDAVRELIMQDRHVTYHDVKASLGINITFWKKLVKNELAVGFSFIMTTPHHIPPHKQLTIHGR
ncbi:hypothetical protein EVAR_34153_1 [Eumeta japonica]|uniref:Histone-lysine N-methyltransferase SETMAR n=1 Tax=Eumeta variegata TaxID=151549 RepID=A0A4C1ZTD0_EUMVA|nr:hypothetical protein EVAR_34153_1 [Eumeta japonica]